MSHSEQLVAERYRLVSQIGSGGMGRVWLSRDEVLRREVAIKEVMLPADMSFEDRNELCQRTLREARAAGRLSHPNVVAVYDVVQAAGRPWIVMEYVRSKSLYQAVKENGPLPPQRVAEIGLAVLLALRAAHKAGVWHRDVKPGNVLLADDGRVVLTDFGLATLDGGDGTVTRSGVILGSAQYISPERARDGASGPESDMWSLGATLYAAAEGRSPFFRETSMATLTALATMPPDAMKRAGILKPLLVGLLRKNPRQRLRPAEAEKILRRVVEGDPKGRRLGRIPPQRRASPPESDEVDSGLASAPDTDDLPAPEQGPMGRVSLKGSPVLARRESPRTATEETFQQVPGGRRRVLYAVIGAIVLVGGAAIPTILFLRGTDPASPPGPTASGLALSPDMGVQACLAQLPAKETRVDEGDTVPEGESAPSDNWGYHNDRQGYWLTVPLGWRMSRIDQLLCFRDPTSERAISVVDLGKVSGSPADLFNQGRAAWLQATDLSQYTELSIIDIHYPEGAADREYTYVMGDVTTMHGRDRLLRMEGRVFLVSFLTTDFDWPTDRVLADLALVSFEVSR